MYSVYGYKNKQEMATYSWEKCKNLIYLSAKTGQGVEHLTEFLTAQAGVTSQQEGCFIARRRHLEALSRTLSTLIAGKKQFEQHNAGELLAEDLRLAQQQLGEITGEFTNEDLLTEIFSSFCLGK